MVGKHVPNARGSAVQGIERPPRRQFHVTICRGTGEGAKSKPTGPEEADIAMVRADVAGWSRGEPKRLFYQLIDRRDMETGFTAMQRTVGYTLSLGARWILRKALARAGLLSPVEIPFGLLEEGLAEVGMRITREELPWRDGDATSLTGTPSSSP